MADPKYANLPGIAFDQPDVFESEDVSPRQDCFLGSQEQSDSIEKLTTDIHESYSKFHGHWLDSNRADFSGKIALKRHTGYSSWNGPYELQAVGEKESLLQKFNRLKCEVADLEEDLARKNFSGDGETLTSAEDLSVQVKHLQKQLMAMKIEENLGAKESQSSRSSWDLPNKCLDELEEVLKTRADVDKSSTVNRTNQIIYELQFNPHERHLELASRASVLLTRLDRLEQYFGIGNQGKLDRLSAETGQKSLLDIVNSMHSKISLLDPSQIDLVESRLNVLNQKLNSISEKGAVLEEAEKQTKLKETYDTVKKLEPLMVVLPSIVDRLLSLKKLHEEAVNFSQCIGQLETTQCQVEESLKSQMKLLSDVQAGVAENLNSLKEAINQSQGK